MIISCHIGSRSHLQVQKKYARQAQLQESVRTAWLATSPSIISLDEGIHQPPQHDQSGILSTVLSTGVTLQEDEEHEISPFLEEVNKKPICMDVVQKEEVSVVSALIRSEEDTCKVF